MRARPPSAAKTFASLVHDGAQLRRIGRDGVVPARHVLVEGEVLLDHAGAQGDGRQGIDVPRVWSLKPTGTSKASRSIAMLRRWMLS